MENRFIKQVEKDLNAPTILDTDKIGKVVGGSFISDILSNARKVYQAEDTMSKSRDFTDRFRGNVGSKISNELVQSKLATNLLNQSLGTGKADRVEYPAFTIMGNISKATQRSGTQFLPLEFLQKIQTPTSSFSATENIFAERGRQSRVKMNALEFLNIIKRANVAGRNYV
jgi:hypothetical protein